MSQTYIAIAVFLSVLLALFLVPLFVRAMICWLRWLDFLPPKDWPQ